MRKIAVTIVAAALAALALAVPAAAQAGPVLSVSSTHEPAQVPTGTHVKFTLRVSDVGDANTSGPVTVEFHAPPGLEVVNVKAAEFFGFEMWSCSIPTPQSASCEGPNVGGFFPVELEPGKEACLGYEGFLPACPIDVIARVDEPAGATIAPTFEACGGGTAACFQGSSESIEVVPYDFELTDFDAKVLDANGDPATQAGSHPTTASTTFRVKGALGPTGHELPIDQVKDATVQLPRGLVGNPQALPTCTQEQLSETHSNRREGDESQCPSNSQVGIATVHTTTNGDATEPGETLPVGVYNMARPGGSTDIPIGTPALFGFNVLGARVEVYVKLRIGDDYGVTVLAKDSPQTLPIGGFDFDFWGVPGDPVHDADRGYASFPGSSLEEFCGQTPNPLCSKPYTAPLRPFLSLPTSCVGPVETSFEITGWLGGFDSASVFSHDNSEPPNPIGNDGCNSVDFSPSLEARPTTNVADSASGLDVDLHLPVHESCDPGPPVNCEASEAQLKDTTVTLPQGMSVNPSGANGLGGCSESDFGYTETDSEETIHTTAVPAACPNASKLGTVEVDSPLLDHPLKGGVYLATPHQNPFGSLLALYLAVDDPETGIVVKLAGEVQTDPQTGQLTTTFEQNPQQPFEDFKLHFFGGAGGSLRTPPTCGTYSTTSHMVPWTAPEGLPAAPSDAWQIEQAPGGGTCPTAPGQIPNSPSLDAGTVSPVAGAYSPFVLNLRREDGTQELSSLSVKAPPGLTGRLAGIPYCSDAALAAAAAKSGREEEASPSCPAASALGTVTAGAGAGPAPYYAHGTAYLTGPYKGAPLGMAIVTPATAGPFDLGTIVVRVALQLDPATGQITATSDPIPSILQGIPLDIRSIQVKLDRSQFTRTGTSCDPSAFAGSLTSTQGATASLSERYQLGECTSLGFKPKLSIRLKGGTKRGAHPALTGFLQMPEGGANIAQASVALPQSEFLDQGHIGTVCTRVQFAEGAGNGSACPPDSVYGQAKATSPLVDYTLEGPVFLRSSEHELPDLVAALHGPPSQPIAVDAAARIDSVKGGIRSTFEGVPDLPVSSFTLEMQGQSKGLLQNSTNICKGVHKATALFDGQNGKAADLFPALKDSKCKGAKRHKRHKRAR